MFRPDELCGDPDYLTPHLFSFRNVPGGGQERRCEYCGVRDPKDRPALPALQTLVPALGTAAAIAVLCTVMPRIAAAVERIAIALENRR